MKRIMWATLLGGLVIAASGTKAADTPQTLVIRPIFASDISIEHVGPAVGLVTFDTETGDWTVTTRKRLPQSDFNIYYPAISTSPVSTSPRSGRWVQSAYSWGYVGSVDGAITASGTVSSEERDLITQALANGGIFLLGTNSV